MIMRMAMYLMPEIRPGDHLNAAEIEAWEKKVVPRDLRSVEPPPWQSKGS